MTCEEILKRLEEVEARCAVLREALEKVEELPWEAYSQEGGSTLGEGDWLRTELRKGEKVLRHVREVLGSDAGRDFLDRLHKLEAVVEAAREIAKCEPYHRDYALSGNSDPRVCYYCEAPWEHKVPQHKPGCPLEKLRRALAALEEER